MGVLVFLAKPLIYLLAFVAATKLWKAHAPHTRLGPVATVVLATLTRLLAGGVGGGVAGLLGGDAFAGSWSFRGILVSLGFVMWLGTTVLFFRKAPRRQVFGFAVVAETVSAAIDLWAIASLGSLRFC